MKILAAEDEEDLREVIKDVLEAGGYSVRTADKGDELLKAVTEESFDVII